MRLLTAEEMRELDRRTIEEVGIPGIVLMENAGRGTADFLLQHFARLAPGPALVLAGKGNNGGDGYVVARHLMNRGWRVSTIVLAEREAIRGDAGLNLDILERSGGEIHFAAGKDDLLSLLERQGDARLVVDALFGTGLTSEIRGHYRTAIDWVNASGLAVLSVDIPSGIDASCGRVLGSAVRADATATFAFAKIGHAMYPGAEMTGDLKIVDIGIPTVLSNGICLDHLLVEEMEAVPLFPPRPATGHKGTFGHLLVIAGGAGKTGAAVMTADSGIRAGAGLVTVGVPESVHSILEIKLTEAMTAPLGEVEGALGLRALDRIRALWEGKNALAVGPGLGTAEETVALVRRMVRECPLPMVLDADALNALAGHAEVLLERRGPPLVLTPHPGEMARLAGTSVPEIQKERIKVAGDFARRFKVVLVLKGARTVTAFPDGRIRINGSGNSGMASGGMGDVLTGLIGGLLAQGCEPADAAVLGVFLHGRAADRIQNRLGNAGMAATDLLKEIPVARKDLIENYPKTK